MPHSSSVRRETEYRKEESPFGRFTFVRIIHLAAISGAPALSDLSSTSTESIAISSFLLAFDSLVFFSRFVLEIEKAANEFHSRRPSSRGATGSISREELSRFRSERVPFARFSSRTRPEINVASCIAPRVTARLVPLSLAPW